MRTVLLGVSLATVLTTTTGRAAGDPPYAEHDSTLQHRLAESPRVYHRWSRWAASWSALRVSDGQVSRVGVGLHLHFGDDTVSQLAIAGRGALETTWRDHIPSFDWRNGALKCSPQLSFLLDTETCGTVTVYHDASPHCRPDPGRQAPHTLATRIARDPRREDLDGLPRCGAGMVEIIDDVDTFGKVPCVSLAHEMSQSLSILEIAVDTHGRPLWALSPTPWAGAPYGAILGEQETLPGTFNRAVVHLPTGSRQRSPCNT